MSKKNRVALFSANFLSISMTFIYRQLIGLEDEFDFSVFTEKVNNSDKFPFSKIYEINREQNLISKATHQFDRLFNQTFIKPTKDQIRYWGKVVRQEGVELIHAHFGVGGLQMLPIAKGMGIPLLTTFHGYDASRLLNSTIYRKHLGELFEYSHVIAISEMMRDKLIVLGANNQRTYRHYIGVPVADFYPKQRKTLAEKLDKDETVIYLQVSNFVEKKGHIYTLEAFSRHIAEFPNCKLIFAGGGPLLEQSIQHARQLSIQDQVDFVGPVGKNQVIDLMSDADIFVHHSVTSSDGDQEGIPTVIMEAMAMNLPVISTRHSGITELIRDGLDGYLVDERDVEEYTSKMKEILFLDTNSSRSWIQEKFNLENNNIKLGGIYHDIIGC